MATLQEPIQPRDTDSSRREAPTEIPAVELEQSFSCSPTVPDGKLRELPIRDTLSSWQDFERLAARLLKCVYKGTISQAFRYGRPGQRQHGIDIVAISPEERATYVVQCKHVQEISRGQLTGWVDEFLKGRQRDGTKKYILCTSFSIESDTVLVDEWKACSFLLAKHEIGAELWDAGRLQQLLREAEAVVIEMFGAAVAERYCVRPSLPSSPYPERFRTTYLQGGSGYLVLENETVRLDLTLPDPSGRELSALLSFARKDLNGVIFGVSADQIIDYIRWRARADRLLPRPYASKLAREDKWVFSTKEVRLVLGAEEVHHLDWVLAKAWDPLLAAASMRESQWKTLRFQRLRHVETERAYGIAKVDRAMWRSMIEFARAHDCAKGTTPWHIFDAAPGLLKVYVQEATDTLDSGYHVILHAYNEAGMWLPWEEDVVVGWTPLLNIGGSAEELSPRKAWDAEYTHDWLLHSLIPEVIRWERAGRTKREHYRWPRLFRQSGSSHVVDVSQWCTSLAECDARILNVSADNIDEVRQLATLLQSHFHGGGDDSPLDMALTRNVLRALDRLVPFADPLDEHYIRSKLPLDRKLPIRAAVRPLIEGDMRDLRGRWGLDLSLRCLMAVLDDSVSVPRNEMAYVVDMLIPVWERFKEDLLCRSVI